MGALLYRLRLRKLQVFHFKLDAHPSVPFVNLRLDREIDGHAGLELVEEIAFAERDAFHVYIALPNEELEVIAGFADATRGRGEGDAFATEQRFSIAVPEGAESTTRSGLVLAADMFPV